MRTREIPCEDWKSFFNQFTLAHQGRHIHVETMDGGHMGVQSRVDDLPLAAVVFADPRAEGGASWVEIIAGREPGDSAAACSVPRPSHVRLAEEENGQAVALQMESADGVVTMVRFEPSRENLPEGFLIS